MLLKEMNTNWTINIESCSNDFPDAITEITHCLRYITHNINFLTPCFINDLKCIYDELYSTYMNYGEKQIIPYFSKNISRGISENIYCKNIDIDTSSRWYFWQLKNIISDTSLDITNRYKLMDFINSFFINGLVK